MSEVRSQRLTDLLGRWTPREVVTARRVDPWPATAFADLLAVEPPDLGEGPPLPPTWHWLALLDHRAPAEMGEDGHPDMIFSTSAPSTEAGGSRGLPSDRRRKSLEAVLGAVDACRRWQ